MIHALCLRQCAMQLAAQAGAISREGAHRAALARAARIGFFNRVLWRTTAGCAAQVVGWK
jgi:hypothetical protein